MWYREAIFKELPSAAFWLTDLKAWALLSVEKEQLEKLTSYKKFFAKLTALQEYQTKGGVKPEPMSAGECPFTDKRCEVLDQNIDPTKKYNVVSAQDFFKWLLTVKDTAILNDEICNKLCKEYGVMGKFAFLNLRDINYCPKSSIDGSAILSNTS